MRDPERRNAAVPQQMAAAVASHTRESAILIAEPPSARPYATAPEGYLGLAHLNGRDAVVPVVAARPPDVMEIRCVGGQRHAVAGVVVLVVDCDRPPIRDANRRDAVVPVRAGAPTTWHIVEVGLAVRHGSAIASEVRVLINDY